MGRKYKYDREGESVRGLQRLRAERKNREKKVYLTGRSLGYHWGYSIGYESGYEKGYSEGSALGHNNGFLEALKLLEQGEDLPGDGKANGSLVWKALQKLTAEGLVRVSLSGCAAREAEVLLKILKIETAESNRGVRI